MAIGPGSQARMDSCFDGGLSPRICEQYCGIDWPPAPMNAVICGVVLLQCNAMSRNSSVHEIVMMNGDESVVIGWNHKFI